MMDQTTTSTKYDRDRISSRKNPRIITPTIIDDLLTDEYPKTFIASDSWVKAVVFSDETFDQVFSHNDFCEMFSDKIQPVNKATIKIAGKTITCPRKTQSYLQDYWFSGQTAKSEGPLPAPIQKLHQFAVSKTHSLNQCLINWYERDGAIGFHSDDERQLVKRTEIYSFSFGPAKRTFLLAPKYAGIGDYCSIPISNNTLVIMGGSCQVTHKHAVLRVKSETETAESGQRLNVTFRVFASPDAQSAKKQRLT